MKKLGFGLMRLPQKDGAIDIERTAEMANEFLKQGFTYFDTAYVYPGSEEAFREAIGNRHPRESYLLADKLPGWVLKCKEDVERVFNESLTRCGVDYFDYYLLHSIQSDRTQNYEKYDCWDFCSQMKKAGKIKNFGFSFHGNEILLEKLLTEHPDVDFVQLQINYLDWNSALIRSAANYEVCRKHGKSIIIMEPVKGGQLASFTPELEQILKDTNPDASCASFALRFAGTLDGVMMVLSGMSDEAQMQDNITTFSDLKPLNTEETKATEIVRDKLLATKTISCTSCKYCIEGCPSGINIPEIFNCSNELTMHGDHNRPHLHYASILNSGQSSRANECIKCGKCEKTCPQHLPIIKHLEDASLMLDK